MAIDFKSSSFTHLSSREKKEIIKAEFIKCSKDFEYYLASYAYIRHPNKGIIKMEAFPFQLDIATPISISLLKKRSEETIQHIRTLPESFDYREWWRNLAEEQLDLSRKVPSEFHEFYRVTRQHEDYLSRIDTIILKSRQTGLSTIFEQLGVWHTNFHVGVYDLIVSQGDREAKKFLNDIVTSYTLIPPPLRAKKINSNEHELWLSITGEKSHKSGLHALPPTTNAGRSYAPDLVILDEFAMYRKAEEVWTSIAFAVSGGGVIVIISTPKGVGNLYHKIWTMTKRAMSYSSFSQASIDDPTASLPVLSNDEALFSAFRPVVVHWTQLPHSEFTRRGFADGLGWYRHMRSKIALELGEKGIAQELDLDFVSSGNTIESKYLKGLKSSVLENSITPIIKDSGVIIYEEPLPDTEYLMGVDVAEGVGEDASDFHVVKVPEPGHDPVVVAKFSSNRLSVFRYKEIVKAVAMWYNLAWMVVERNNHGHVLLTYFIDSKEYPAFAIMSQYNFKLSSFHKDIKGWLTSTNSRDILIATLFEFIRTRDGVVPLPAITVDEFSTFVQKPNGRWDAMSGFHDDGIFSFSLCVQGVAILARYKAWLLEQEDGIPTEIDYGDALGSSTFLPNATEGVVFYSDEDLQKRYASSKEKSRIDELRMEYAQQRENIEEKLPVNFRRNPEISQVTDMDYEDADVF
jgi:hypothetical protein